MEAELAYIHAHRTALEDLGTDDAAHGDADDGAPLSQTIAAE